jgi:hypothetical protein
MRTYSVPKFQVGDKVAYSVQFLKSCGMSHGEAAHARGTITGIQALGSHLILASIDWKGADMPERVNVFNLAKVGANPRFANVD